MEAARLPARQQLGSGPRDRKQQSIQPSISHVRRQSRMTRFEIQPDEPGAEDPVEEGEVLFADRMLVEHCLAYRPNGSPQVEKRPQQGVALPIEHRMLGRQACLWMRSPSSIPPRFGVGRYREQVATRAAEDNFGVGQVERQRIADEHEGIGDQRLTASQDSSPSCNPRGLCYGIGPTLDILVYQRIAMDITSVIPCAQRSSTSRREQSVPHFATDAESRVEPIPTPGQIPLELDAAPPLALESVNVGLPAVIGASRSGEPIVSGIVKTPVAATTLSLDWLNLEGDRQADLTVHGGPDKAVYAYPAEHLPLWNAELGTAFGPGTFGENLTTRGWREDDVFIGDIWAWGEALVQVSQPRSPCYKLATVTGRPELVKRFVQTGRTGWYLRVLQPGVVPAAGPLRLVSRHPAAISVLRVHRLLLPEPVDRDELEAIAAVEELAASWRDGLRQELARAE
jgi:MOSC domain-containing protein YiiM